MKFYGGLIVAIIALVLLLMWLKENSENAPATAAASTTTPLAAATGAPAPVSAYSPPMAVATPASYATSATPITYVRPAAATPSVSPGCHALAPAAQRAKCTVVSCMEQGGYTVITLWGYDRNNLNDFLDEAMRAGARDFAPGQRLVQSVVQGRVRYQNTFRIQF